MPSPPHRAPAALARALAALALTASLTACGATSASPVGTSHEPRPARPISLTLRSSDGRIVALEDQRGAPILLAVLATYDGVSQAAMRPLSRFARHHEEVLVLGVLAQPEARTFAPLFEEAMRAPFAITWDPSDAITRGVSDLGPLEAVPSYVRIDPSGRIVAQHVGFLDEDDLERFMAP